MKRYTHIDGTGMRWRFNGSRPVSELADEVMAAAERETKGGKTMKRIIGGKRYDTETATEIATFEASCPRSDFHHYTETLHRTPKGAFFLSGEGGALSPYSEPLDSNTSTGGSGMRAITDAEAQEWLERHEFTEELEAHFSGTIEDA